MASVTGRINEIKQPYGGYLPLKSFTKIPLTDNFVLNETENLHASTIGLTVDYLTRFMMGDAVEKAFDISLIGASNIEMDSKAELLLSQISGLDDLSIVCACKLTGFDVCYRVSPDHYKPIENIKPDSQTIENIRIMVNRCISFWEKYGPVVCSEPTFEGGYTSLVNAGDGDFVTANTLWDLKVIKSSPTTKHTLQILMYYIMGQHSIHNYYDTIQNIGIFNPRLNIVYTKSVSTIPEEIIQEVSRDVIGYPSDSNAWGAFFKPEYNSEPDQLLSINPIPPEVLQEDYTVQDICALTGLKKKKIYNAIRSGSLSAYKEGRQYYITPESYESYLSKLKFQQALLLISIFSPLIVLIMYFLFGNF